ncbi:MAG: AEC family transporter [Elusimicrobia bacterium]|nr:AEC family transporter [Elusimicrobiota bacterium]MBU2615070.1 AEC family transporter [Elusimicrobiota bacterium]
MFIEIFMNVIIPVFFIIAVGYIMEKKFKLNMRTLSDLNFYVFVPALIFVKMLDSDLQPSKTIGILLFYLIHFAILFAISFILFSPKVVRQKRTTLTLCTVFHNAGNYGIPLMLLAYGTEGVSVIAIIMIALNLLCFTMGIFMMESEHKDMSKTMVNLLKIPVIYAIFIGFALRFFHLNPPHQIMIPIGHLADGLIAVALLTLGAQLALSKPGKDLKFVSLGVFMRLVIAPIIAVLLVPFFKFTGNIGPIMILSSGLPVAVNAYLLAAEYDNEAELASQLVFWSTVLSAFSIPVILYFLR